MNLLITGASGFVGKNLTASLEAIRDGKDNVHRINTLDKSLNLHIFRYDLNSSPEDLDCYCKTADFVFHLAGVNRPENEEDFMRGNFGFSSLLLDILKKHHNTCPVLLSSSVQASLEGRFAGSAYGRSKLAGENLFLDYQRDTGAKVLIYRFPNLFGKWCRPNYNSAVATFCHNIANNLPIQVNDPHTVLELVYIDDVVEEFFRALNNEEHRDGQGYCYVPQIHSKTLGEIVELINGFKQSHKNKEMPCVREGSFSKKLYATYLSYLPPEDMSYLLQMNTDIRGSFTEILRTPDRGQFSVNISRPGITKGQHWHHSKHEKFIVVSGSGIIRLRKIGTNPKTGDAYPVLEYPVNGTELTVVEIIPGYTHNIQNVSATEDLVTLMWCSECFDQGHPDTYYEEV